MKYREVLGGHQNNFFSNFDHMASYDWMIVNNEPGRILKGAVMA
jgi:hypothetical protein